MHHRYLILGKEKEKRGTTAPVKRRHEAARLSAVSAKRQAPATAMPPPAGPRTQAAPTEPEEVAEAPGPAPEDLPQEEEEEPMGPTKPSETPVETTETPVVEEEEEPKGLPEGFFDDPDMDAKMRGEEAPSKRAERELEEGLKRFEREMQAEQERAEEKRHVIDEEKYELAAVEEQEFQVQLQSRLEKLRQQTATRKLKLPKEDVEEKVEDGDEDEEDDDDEDLALDWRAKGFS
eukprot:Skav234908  [mRNA]  locus=scaffold840:808083:809156:+ [translate_table: standard]